MKKTIHIIGTPGEICHAFSIVHDRSYAVESFIECDGYKKTECDEREINRIEKDLSRPNGIQMDFKVAGKDIKDRKDRIIIPTGDFIIKRPKPPKGGTRIRKPVRA